MENTDNKKNGKATKIIVITIILISIAVLIIFISLNRKNNNINNENKEVSKDDSISNSLDKEVTSNKNVSTLSDEELRKMVERCFAYYEPINTANKIERIEKYEEDGKGNYIYVIYRKAKDKVDFCWINTTESTENPKIYYCGTHKDNLDKAIKEAKEADDDDVNWMSWDMYNKSNSSSSSNKSNNTNSTTNDNSATSYFDDKTLIVLALKKWFEEDSYTSYQYYNSIPSVYTGKVTKKSDGSVNVYITLYEKEGYKTCMEYGLDVSGVSWNSNNINLTKEEATKK